MHRFVGPACIRSKCTRGRAGYTLVEMLVATVLTLVMMGAVVQIFASIGESVKDSRATLEMSERLRAVGSQLSTDLQGVTATMLPPRNPESNEGYFEYIEGPIGPAVAPHDFAANLENSANPRPDTTPGDFDDILMFTARSSGRPFVGRCPLTGGTVESDLAEIVWFVRGRTLYRRVMLVAPNLTLPPNCQNGFYRFYDLSVHWDGYRLVPNTLGDLTKRECRFAHHPNPSQFPGHPHAIAGWKELGLPTLCECSSPKWVAGYALPPVKLSNVSGVSFDAWTRPHVWDQLDKELGVLSQAPDYAYYDPLDQEQRIAEDVILTNVIGFDVRAWDPRAPILLVDIEKTPNRSDDVVLSPGDPNYLAVLNDSKLLWPSNPQYGAQVGRGTTPLEIRLGAYVDLNYRNLNAPDYLSAFSGSCPVKSGLAAFRVYDTWSTHYESDGIDQFNDGLVDSGANGFDDTPAGGAAGLGIVDDIYEQETSPPYPEALRGIQIKLRVFEPDSRQIREVTIVHDFLPK